MQIIFVKHFRKIWDSFNYHPSTCESDVKKTFPQLKSLQIWGRTSNKYKLCPTKIAYEIDTLLYLK